MYLKVVEFFRVYAAVFLLALFMQSALADDINKLQQLTMPAIEGSDGSVDIFYVNFPRNMAEFVASKDRFGRIAAKPRIVKRNDADMMVLLLRTKKDLEHLRDTAFEKGTYFEGTLENKLLTLSRLDYKDDRPSKVMIAYSIPWLNKLASITGMSSKDIFGCLAQHIVDVVKGARNQSYALFDCLNVEIDGVNSKVQEKKQ